MLDYFSYPRIKIYRNLSLGWRSYGLNNPCKSFKPDSPISASSFGSAETSMIFAKDNIIIKNIKTTFFLLCISHLTKVIQPRELFMIYHENFSNNFSQIFESPQDC